MSLLSSKAKHPINLTLNGVSRSGYAEPRMLLSDFLRHELGATGTHVGCEHGVCGACTVQLDGEPVRSCLVLAIQVRDRHISTVEGLSAEDGKLGLLQLAFRKHHALQCGYCTSGILMSLDAFFRENVSPGETSIREVLSGHICRCTGYTPIVSAALEVAGLERERPEQQAED
ncbi:MAG: (2Fe-2S)-binding protein [Hyphomicrobiaceae bacterium]